MKQENRPVWPYLALLAAGLLLAAFVDLPLNEAAYSPTNGFAIFMECYGWYPVALAPLAFFVSLARDGKSPLLRATGFVAVALVLAVLAWISHGYLEKRGWDTLRPAPVLCLVAVLLCLCGWLLALWRAPLAQRRALRPFAQWGSVLALAQLLLVNGIKLLWNRARFDEMLAGMGLGLFSPWYQPFAGGGSSFPSGHTANAACILALVLLCDTLPALQKRRGLVYALCWAYIVAMAFARVLIGRHFLSDTLAASAIVALLLYGIRRTKACQKAIALAQKPDTNVDIEK